MKPASRSNVSPLDHIVPRSNYMNLGIPQITTWEQAALADPSNPNQHEVVRYTQIPGGYNTFYYNQVPTTAQLSGSLGGVWDSIGSTGQGLVVSVIGIVAGFFGWRALKGKKK